MTSTVVQWFEQSEDLQVFGAKLMASRGAFALERAELLAFGEALQRRFPAGHPESSRSAYLAIRLCLREKLIGPLPEAAGRHFRELLTEVGRHEDTLGSRPAGADHRQFRESIAEIEKRRRRLATEIDLLPNGRAKERFSGGISLFANLLYLAQQRLGPSPCDETSC